MFRFKVSDARLLEGFVAAVCTVVDEASFAVEPDGVKLRAIDPSHVVMVDLEMPREAFDEYECASAHKVCVDAADLLKLLKRAGRGEAVSLVGGGERLTVEVSGRYERRFNMPVLEPREEELRALRLDADVKAKLPTAGLRQALEDVALAGEDVRVGADSERLVLCVSGSVVNARVELPKGDALLELVVRSPSKALYSLGYLLETVKASSAVSDVVTLEFSTDTPLKTEFSAVKGRLTFWFAPKIEVAA